MANTIAMPFKSYARSAAVISVSLKSADDNTACSSSDGPDRLRSRSAADFYRYAAGFQNSRRFYFDSFHFQRDDNFNHSLNLAPTSLFRYRKADLFNISTKYLSSSSC